MLQLDKGCGKYVSLYEVGHGGILALDDYHKDKGNIEEGDKQMAVRLQQFYPQWSYILIYSSNFNHYYRQLV